MTRPLAYITAPWGTDTYENAITAAGYCLQVFEAGYTPVCPVLFMPTFLKSDDPEHIKGRREMCDELIKRSRIVIVCGDALDDEIRYDLALAKRRHITYTTLTSLLALSGLS